MSSLLDFIKAFGDAPLVSFVAIILFIAAIKGLYEFIKWIKEELDKWYKVRHEEDEKDETIAERLDKLEKENEEQTNRCESITAALANINRQIMCVREDYAKVTVALTRASLHNLCDDLKDREYISEAEYETFVDLRDVYLKSGGNAVFKNKIIPFIENIPVKD